MTKEVAEVEHKSELAQEAAAEVQIEVQVRTSYATAAMMMTLLPKNPALLTTAAADLK